MMQRKCVAVFTAHTISEAGTWPVWFKYDSLPQEAKDEKDEVWGYSDLDTPSKNQHFFFKSTYGYHHTSELIEVREGHPLHGFYTFYLLDFLLPRQVLAVTPAGSFALGEFAYA